MKYAFITDSIESGAVRLKWIPAREQLADIFTKPLDGQTFTRVRKELMTR